MNAWRRGRAIAKEIRDVRNGPKRRKFSASKLFSARRPDESQSRLEPGSGSRGERRTLLPALFPRPYPGEKHRKPCRINRGPPDARSRKSTSSPVFPSAQQTQAARTYTNEEGTEDKAVPRHRFGPFGGYICNFHGIKLEWQQTRWQFNWR